MMFVEYFVWSAWYVTLGTWLGIGLHFDGARIGLVAGTTAIAAIVSPLFMGVVADGFLAAEKLLAILHGIGGVVLLLAARQHTFGGIYTLFLIYSICYMPTMALTNAVCFRHIADVKQQFAGIRVFGTLGWIVAGLLVGFAKIEASAMAVQLAAVASFVMAAYSLTLPKTPPAGSGEFKFSDVFGGDALKLMKKPSFAVFIAASFLICIPLQFYYAFTNLYLNEIGVQNAAAKMTLGQMSELCLMVAIPWFFRRLGVKYMLALGMLAWVIRYAMFAYGNAGGLILLLYAGLLLHGICYDFFFVSGQIYVDNSVALENRAAAQGLITLVTYGLGMLAGSWVSGRIVDSFSVQIAGVVSHHWKMIWLTPAAICVVVLVGFLALFHDKGERVTEEPAGAGVEAVLPA
jgi:nucleoside transporter